MRCYRTSFLWAATSSLLICAVTAAQTMVEYGHLAGGAAKAAASMRDASPAGALGKLRQSLEQQAGPASSARPFAALAGSPAPAPAVRTNPSAPLSVVRVEWGSNAAERADEPVASETSLRETVVATPAEEASFDFAAAGLAEGMTIAEVSKVLGDPYIRTAGLAGRGYDEKAMYRLSSGWRVVVFAANGRARGFRASQDRKKASQKMLSSAGPVVP